MTAVCQHSRQFNVEIFVVDHSVVERLTTRYENCIDCDWHRILTTPFAFNLGATRIERVVRDDRVAA